MKNKIYLYDTTLRDGGQTPFIDFSLNDKLDIVQKLDTLGVDYIEAGWPGANPVDSEFFDIFPKTKKSIITAFGMTHKAKLTVNKDKGFSNLLESKAKIITIVGKSWDFQVREALNISLKKNLEIIKSSIKALQEKKKEVFFDAEHFFDGYKENPEYSLEVIKTAYQTGVRWIVLCDTNGGTLPNEIYDIIKQVTKKIKGENIGIHCHNDTGNAVANSLEAIRAGARQIQGTLNGLGERCGNANLISLIPTLKLKLGYNINISNKQLQNLKILSNYLCDLLNYPYHSYAPYVGNGAFAHKGGLHASGVIKNTKCYEHIEPSLVGNQRNILISNQSGRASIISRLNKVNIKVSAEKLDDLIALIKKKEAQGFSYDIATASFVVLVKSFMGNLKECYQLERYKVLNEKRRDKDGKIVTFSEAVIKLLIKGKLELHVAEGNGPVAALSNALKEILIKHYPKLEKTKLSDYKVRIIDSKSASSASIRVIIENTDEKGRRWGSVGVATDIIDASYMAIKDSICYYLMC